MIRGRPAQGSGKDYWGVVLEAPDAPSLARFYVDLLGWRFAGDPEGAFVTIWPGEGVASIAVNTSAEYVAPVWPPKDGQQQMMLHLDVEVDDLDSAVEDAVALGASVAAYQPQEDVRVLLDPAGHPFCLYVDTSG